MLIRRCHRSLLFKFDPKVSTPLRATAERMSASSSILSDFFTNFYHAFQIIFKNGEIYWHGNFPMQIDGKLLQVWLGFGEKYVHSLLSLCGRNHKHTAKFEAFLRKLIKNRYPNKFSIGKKQFISNLTKGEQIVKLYWHF